MIRMYAGLRALIQLLHGPDLSHLRRRMIRCALNAA